MKGFALIQLFHSFLNIVFFVQQSPFSFKYWTDCRGNKKKRDGVFLWLSFSVQNSCIQKYFFIWKYIIHEFSTHCTFTEGFRVMIVCVLVLKKIKNKYYQLSKKSGDFEILRYVKSAFAPSRNRIGSICW